MVQTLPTLDVVKTLFKDQIPFAETMWRLMSGHAHGFAYAVQATSKIEQSIEIPGGISVTVTVGDDTLSAILHIVAILLFKSMAIYVDRSERPIISASTATL